MNDAFDNKRNQADENEANEKGENQRIEKEAKTKIQHCTTEFIHVVVTESLNQAFKRLNKPMDNTPQTIEGQDIVNALNELGFERYNYCVKKLNDLYSEHKEKNKKKLGRPSTKKRASADDANGSETTNSKRQKIN